MGEARRWELGLAAAFVVGLFILLGANVATGSRVIAGNVVLDFELGSVPKALPKHENAPISFWGSIGFGTRDGTVPPPLQRMAAEIDRFGSVETDGLPTCTPARLKATDVAQARRACPDAIVGTGRGVGVVTFPEQAPIPASSPITFFNGPPIGSDPTVIVHAHLTIPAPTTYLVTLRIEHIDNGVYGFRIASDFPKIAGGYGSVTGIRFRVNRRWSQDGKSLSYLNARCAIGRLQAKLETVFVDGTRLRSHYVHPCQVR